MSSSAKKQASLVDALLKTVIIGGGAWFAIWLIALAYVVMAQVAGAGWKGYSTFDHWDKFWCPGFEWWLFTFFIQSWVKEGTKKWWLATTYLIVMAPPLFFWTFTDVPMGSAAQFWYRYVPADLFGGPGLNLAKYLFPDYLPSP